MRGISIAKDVLILLASEWVVIAALLAPFVYERTFFVRSEWSSSFLARILFSKSVYSTVAECWCLVPSVNALLEDDYSLTMILCHG